MVVQSRVHKKIPAAGIDIGFFSTKFSLGETLGQSGSQIVVDQFHSLAAQLSRPALPQLPNSADLDAAVVTVQGVPYGVGKGVLSLLGPTGQVRAPSHDYCKSPAYHALLLGALFYIAKGAQCTGDLAIETLTLGLPLNTVYDHSEFVQALATGEHIVPAFGRPDATMKVIVQNAVVIAQPQGAIVNYTSGLKRNVKADEMCLVLDMGGGTFDWFVCAGDYVPDYERCGATNTGALACANVVCDSIKPGLKEDARTVAKIDLALRTGEPSVSIAGREHKLDLYWPMVSATLHKAMTQMRNQVGRLDGFDHILLTGGGATILHKVFLAEHAEYANITKLDDEPVFSNVKGFHRIAQYIGDSSQ